MKSEEITKVLESLNPAIEAITDQSVKAILNTLITLINEQQKIIEEQKKEIDELKEKLNTNSNNSSNPPSSNHFKKSKKKKSKRKQGAQPGHKGVFRKLLPVEEVDYVERCKPPKRCNCGSRIILTENYRRHQVHELPKAKATVTEYQLHSGICFGCGKIHPGELPIGVPKGMLGPIAMAKIATLTGDYKMSKRNVTFLLEDFYGLDICIGTVSNTEKMVSKVLEKPVEEAKGFVPQQNRVNADETSHAEKGNKMWTWAFVAASVAVFIIRPSRGAQVVKDFLGGTFNGILSTDRWSAYTWLAVIFRQLCWAHLKRDFQKISERSGKSGKIGEELLACTRRTFKYWHKVRDGTLTRTRFQKLMVPIRHQVEILLEEGKRCSNKKTAGTCKQVLKLKNALWTFIDKTGLEPTNNLAEQILRRIVIWRKTSFGTQSSEGTVYLERIMTVVTTCKLQKRNVLDFITDAINADLNETKMPSLLPMLGYQNQIPEVARGKSA